MPRVRLVVVAAGCALAVAACGNGSTLYGGGTATTTSSTVTTVGGTGARGRVTAGPTCPVERAGQPCPPQPVHADVEAFTTGGRRAGVATTDAGGNFAIALRPGDYTLHVVTSGQFPHCRDVPVTVTSGPPATADITCDTGIR